MNFVSEMTLCAELCSDLIVPRSEGIILKHLNVIQPNTLLSLAECLSLLQLADEGLPSEAVILTECQSFEVLSCKATIA
jgi:hypothetical protein